LLSLGVLLLLAAGVTFLAANWDPAFPAAAQAGIIGTLTVLALAGSVPAGWRSPAGTAEASPSSAAACSPSTCTAPAPWAWSHRTPSTASPTARSSSDHLP